MAGELLYDLSSNDLVEALALRVRLTPADWDQLSARHKHIAVKSSINQVDKDQLLGRLSEVYLRCVMEDFADGKPEVKIDPIPDSAKKGRFRFNQGFNGTLEVRDRHIALRNPYRDGYSEYDGLAMIGNLPTVIEIKAGRTRHSINRAFHPREINYRLRPLAHYFGVKQFGYMVVIPPDMINPNSTNQQRFQELGGILVPLYTTTSKFLAEIEQNRDKWKVDWSDLVDQPTQPTFRDLFGTQLAAFA